MGDTAGECVLTVADTTTSEWCFGGNWCVCYNHDASVILSTEPQSQSIRLYSRDGSLLSELRGHTECINKILCVPISSSGQPTAVARVRSLLLCCLRARTNGTCSRLSLLYQERAIMLRIFFAVREYESPMILSADRGDGTILWESPQHLWESPQRFSSPDLDMSDPDQELLLDESTLCVSFSNCGRYFATVSNKAVRLWQSNTRKLLWTREPESLYY